MIETIAIGLVGILTVAIVILIFYIGLHDVPENVSALGVIAAMMLWLYLAAGFILYVPVTLVVLLKAAYDFGFEIIKVIDTLNPWGAL